MQSQYYCTSRFDFPLRAKERFRNLNLTEGQDFSGAQEVKIADVNTRTIEGNRYLWGTILFKVSLKDFDYSVNNRFNLTRRHKDNYYTETVPFIMHLGGRNIIFFRKKVADKYARKILATLLFSNPEAITPVNFNIEGIRQNINSGNFGECWMNLVRCRGNINSQRQVGSNIDLDVRFLDGPEYNRNGIGIEINFEGERFKVAIFKEGTIVLFKSYKDLTENILLYFDLLNILAEYRL